MAMMDAQVSVSALAVAAWIINHVHAEQGYIDNLKLQKLLYYAQAWCLATTGKPLFSETIEAWPRGPVVPDVYHVYKSHKWHPIMEEHDKPDLPPNVEAHLRGIMEEFGHESGPSLEYMTHCEDPWKDAAPGAVIEHGAMFHYYYRQATDGR